MKGKQFSKKSNEEKKAQKKQMDERLKQEQDTIWMERETLLNFLRFASAFHHYSYHNQLLIHARFPNSRRVNTFKNWEKLKRKVKKGEKGIEIYKPIPKKWSVEKEVVDANGHPVLDADGNVKKEQKQVSFMDYGVAYVYDLTQTEGEPVPELESISTEDALFETDEDLYDALKNINGNIQSYMQPDEMLRFIAEDAIKEKSLLAEDFETEACTYILMSYLQLDSSKCDTALIFDWAKGRKTEEIIERMSKIQKASKNVISKLEVAYV